MRDTRLLQRLGILPTPKDFRTTRIDGADLSYKPAPGISVTPKAKPVLVPKPASAVVPKPPVEKMFVTMSYAERMNFAQAWTALPCANLAHIKQADPTRFNLLKRCYDWSLDAVPSNAKWGDLSPRQQASLAANDRVRFNRMLQAHRESR